MFVRPQTQHSKGYKYCNLPNRKFDDEPRLPTSLSETLRTADEWLKSRQSSWCCGEVGKKQQTAADFIGSERLCSPIAHHSMDTSGRWGDMKTEPAISREAVSHEHEFEFARQVWCRHTQRDAMRYNVVINIENKLEARSIAISCLAACREQTLPSVMHSILLPPW